MTIEYNSHTPMLYAQQQAGTLWKDVYNVQPTSVLHQLSSQAAPSSGAVTPAIAKVDGTIRRISTPYIIAIVVYCIINLAHLIMSVTSIGYLNLIKIGPMSTILNRTLQFHCEDDSSFQWAFSGAFFSPPYSVKSPILLIHQRIYSIRFGVRVCLFVLWSNNI